ncbi:MAG: mandelate racemase/muconate lactonizing enzyme family protein [Betaproteobacteria bacterium]|nr:mandelate racemase/muconate lactonizing enzyme family protein [Betaproteobacteria bacterium]
MTPLPQSPLSIERVEAFTFRAPIATPVRTSFGEMHDRPAVFVRVTDTDGAMGWGEVWCNFPACGAEHRARLVETVMRPLLVGKSFTGPEEAYALLTERTAVLAIQSGEPGPIAQAIAGLDLALWDLCARRAKQPLWRYLGGTSDQVTVYASGINPDHPQDTVAACKAQGYTAFKLKIGFGQDRDLANLKAIRQQFGQDFNLMADANQAWSLNDACQMAPRLSEFALTWLEEPLRADRPVSEWQALGAACTTPLAAGENIMGEANFHDMLDHAPTKVIQPDIAKWGGISGCWPVIQAIQAKGRMYCPHYLGAGVGLLASAHLLAAVGGGGMLEIDSNPNPLRSRVAGPLNQIVDGSAHLGEEVGVGVPVQLQLAL